MKSRTCIRACMPPLRMSRQSTSMWNGLSPNIGTNQKWQIKNCLCSHHGYMRNIARSPSVFSTRSDTAGSCINSSRCHQFSRVLLAVSFRAYSPDLECLLVRILQISSIWSCLFCLSAYSLRFRCLFACLFCGFCGFILQKKCVHGRSKRAVTKLMFDT